MIMINRHLTDRELQARGFRQIGGMKDTTNFWTAWQNKGVVLVRDERDNRRIVSQASVTYTGE